MEFGFGTLPTSERLASDFWESPPQAVCSGRRWEEREEEAKDGQKSKRPSCPAGDRTPCWVGLRLEVQDSPSGFHPRSPKASHYWKEEACKRPVPSQQAGDHCAQGSPDPTDTSALRGNSSHLWVEEPRRV